LLQLRVYGNASTIVGVAEELGRLPGARHVGMSDSWGDGSALVTADIRPEAADEALTRLGWVGIPADDVTLVRLDTIGPAATVEPLVLVWADVLSQARVRARAPARYLVLMAVAGVIAGLAVVNDSSVLIVGAMAISPDLLPVTAACTGLVLRRRRLVGRGLATLVLGLAVACVLAIAVTLLLRAIDRLPNGFTLGEIPAAQKHVNATTILVALAAGVAGMLAVETRASAAVGVGISVTTIPASAYLGVAIGMGELRKSWSPLAVLGANITMMLLGGSVALAIQRLHARAARDDRRLPDGGAA
jgi:uncharacterized hydrophobic protein (TIGR00271 family)